jgi:prevent-host-death family protein
MRRCRAREALWLALGHRLYVDVRRRTVWVMTSMSASEARAVPPKLLNRVEDGEEITLPRHGRPVAVLVCLDSLCVRRAEIALDEAARFHNLLAEAAATRLLEGIGLAR